MVYLMVGLYNVQVHARSAVVLSEQETPEQKDTAESQPAAMPDYAAGLLAPAFDVGVSSQLLYIQCNFTI